MSRVPGFAIFLLAVALLLGLHSQGTAQPQPDSTSVRGTVQRVTKAKKGEIDGVMLEDGTWVHWPPHLEGRFSDLAKTGDRIRANGRWEKEKDEKKFKVDSLTNLTTNQTATSDEQKPPGPKGGTDTIRGTVQALKTGPKGELEGATLDDGTRLHWPPHLGTRLPGQLHEGDRVRATGHAKEGKKDDRKDDKKFEVESLVNLTSGQTILGAPADTPAAIPTLPADRANRLRQLEKEAEDLRREIERVRNAK